MRLVILGLVLALSAPGMTADQPAAPKADPANGWKLVTKLTGFEKPVTAIAVSPNWIAAGAEDGGIRLWDVKTGKPWPQPIPPTKIDQPICELRVGPDGASLYVIEGLNTLRYLIVKDGRVTEKAPLVVAGRVLSGGPDFKTWAVETKDNVKVIETDLAVKVALREKVTLDHQKWVYSAFKERTSLERYRPGIKTRGGIGGPSGYVESEGQKFFGPPVASATVLPDEHGVIVMTPAYGPIHWDKLGAVSYFRELEWCFATLATADSRWLLASFAETDSYPRYSRKGAPKPRLLWPPDAKLITDDRSTVRYAREDRDRIHVVDCATGKLVNDHYVPADSARVLTLGSQNSQLFTGGIDGIVRVWTVRYISPIVTGEMTPKERLRLSEDPTYVETPVAELRGHTGPIRCLTFDKATNRLYSGGDDKTLLVWEKPK